VPLPKLLLGLPQQSQTNLPLPRGGWNRMCVTFIPSGPNKTLSDPFWLAWKVEDEPTSMTVPTPPQVYLESQGGRRRGREEPRLLPTVFSLPPT
jgi:hypothetical protein